MTGLCSRLIFLGAESPAVFGLDRAVGPDIHGQDEIARGERIVELPLTGDELPKLFDQHLGDFDLGISLRVVGYREAVLIAPRWDHAIANRFLENCERAAGFSTFEIHGRIRVAKSGLAPM